MKLADLEQLKMGKMLSFDKSFQRFHSLTYTIVWCLLTLCWLPGERSLTIGLLVNVETSNDDADKITVDVLKKKRLDPLPSSKT